MSRNSVSLSARHLQCEDQSDVRRWWWWWRWPRGCWAAAAPTRALLIFSAASHKRAPPTQNWLPAPPTVKLIEAAIRPAKRPSSEAGRCCSSGRRGGGRGEGGVVGCRRHHPKALPPHPPHPSPIRSTRERRAVKAPLLVRGAEFEKSGRPVYASCPGARTPLLIEKASQSVRSGRQLLIAVSLLDVKFAKIEKKGNMC